MRVALSTLFAIITVGTLCICTSQTAKPELSLKATSSQLSSSESGTNSLRPLPHAHTVVIAPTTTLSAPSTSVPVPVATPTTTTTTTTTTVPPVSITGGWTYEAATKVAVCEEGGWVGAASASYPDSLGITAANWYANGGGSCVTPECQIQVAERLQAYPPDQNGCTSW